MIPLEGNATRRVALVLCEAVECAGPLRPAALASRNGNPDDSRPNPPHHHHHKAPNVEVHPVSIPRPALQTTCNCRCNPYSYHAAFPSPRVSNGVVILVF